MTNTIKDRIIRDLKPTDAATTLIDSNHVTRRHFRLWLEGSYLGEEHGNKNKAELKAIIEREGLYPCGDVAIEKWAAREFITFTAYEYGCSWSYAQKCIADFIKSSDLTFDRVNDHLGRDAIDLIEDWMVEFRKNWYAEGRA